jgi:hypothetical protein
MPVDRSTQRHDSQSQHGSDRHGVHRHNRLSIPTISSSTHALIHLITPHTDGTLNWCSGYLHPSGTIPLQIDHVIDKPSLRLLLLTRCSVSWTMPSPQVSGQTDRGQSPGRTSDVQSKGKSHDRTRLDSSLQDKIHGLRRWVYPSVVVKPSCNDVLATACWPASIVSETPLHGNNLSVSLDP